MGLVEVLQGSFCRGLVAGVLILVSGGFKLEELVMRRLVGAGQETPSVSWSTALFPFARRPASLLPYLHAFLCFSEI